MIAAALFFLIISVPAAPENIWIIEDPSALAIYNRYEQRLTAGEQSRLGNYGPWRIIDRRFVLSDRFTTTVKAEYENTIYHLQTDENDQLVNQGAAGSIQKIHPGRIRGDTIRTVNDDIIFINPSGSGMPLVKGSLLIRMFTYRNQLFVKDIGRQQYGWISGTDTGGWEVYQAPSTADAYTKHLFDRIDRVVMSYNNRLRRLFEYLNHKHDRQVIPPQWTASRDPGILRYTLDAAAGGRDFTRSQAYLIQELEDLLHGSPYQLQIQNSGFIISKSF